MFIPKGVRYAYLIHETRLGRLFCSMDVRKGVKNVYLIHELDVSNSCIRYTFFTAFGYEIDTPLIKLVSTDVFFRKSRNAIRS